MLHNFAFRLSNYSQNVDVIISRDSTKSGTITNYATVYDDNADYDDDTKERHINRDAYIQTITLTDNEVEVILGLISKYAITEIPFDTEITDWIPVLDGETYYFEQKINGEFVTKVFGNPASQTYPKLNSF